MKQQVEARQRIGDWEGDTITGRRHQGSLVSLVEDKSLDTLLGSARHKTAEHVKDQVADSMKPHKDRVHTITFDHGKEFAKHKELAKEFEADIYFAHPYASWQRRLNENTNGLIRQQFPKCGDPSSVTTEEIEDAMSGLNNRPRKTLEYKTPAEVFFNINSVLTQNVTLTT